MRSGLHIDEYFDNIRQVLKNFSPFISSDSLTFDRRSSSLGKIKGQISFLDSSCLYILEIIDANQQSKIRYSYHYQNTDEKFIFRYDNAPHYRRIKTFPHHKHFMKEENVYPSNEPILKEILREIINLFLQKY